MNGKKWRMLRRAGALARRHMEAPTGGRRFRAIVHEMHRRVDIADGRRMAKATMRPMEQDL